MERVKEILLVDDSETCAFLSKRIIDGMHICDSLVLKNNGLNALEYLVSQKENGFGPHVGFGFDLEIADRIKIVAEGIYRFVNLKGFTGELHPGFKGNLLSKEPS